MLELLSPAGSPEAVTAAVQNGADAVYLGCGDFNARRRARNFTPDDLARACAYCHVRGVKVYLTLNTLLSDRELAAALDLAAFANEIGVDAVLVQDLGLAQALRRRFPDLPLHGSTQMTVHSLAGVEFCAKMGLSRVVLSRELDREAIAYICRRAPVEVEVFVHGALCMCYSGQCFLSAMLGGRSGNRGLCAQPCRLPYNGGHPLSLKDSSLAGHLKELDEMGVACVKIEGRMKRPEYVAVVTGVYAAALREGREPTEEELRALENAFSRSGFTQGYYLGETGPEMFGVRAEGDPPESLFAAARESYRRETPQVGLTLSATLRAGQPAALSVQDDLGHTVQVQGAVPEPARARATTEEDVRGQLGKTGGTPYAVTSLHLAVEPGLAVPKSALNALRREALERLTDLRAAPPPRRVLPDTPTPSVPGPSGPPEFIFSLRAPEQLTPELWALPHRFIDLPAAAFVRDPERVRAARADGAKFRVALPRVCWDRERHELDAQLDAAAALGAEAALAPTWDLLQAAKDHGFACWGDFGLGVYNSRTLEAMAALGFAGATASFELKLPMVRGLSKPLPLEAIVYGRLPLMLLEQAPGGRAADGLTDRLGVTFPLLPTFGGRWELLNSQVLYLADKADWKSLGLAAARLLFTDESPRRCVQVAQEYRAGGQPPKPFTRGLYYRDVE